MFAAQRVVPDNLVATSSAAGGPNGVQYARKCVSDIITGIQHYDTQVPEVQSLLEQLALAIDALRKPPMHPAQPTFQALQARQASAVHTNPVDDYKIFSEPVTPAVSEHVPPPSATVESFGSRVAADLAG